MRSIIHVDMDCFYAQVEMRDNPALQGKPVAVGGDPNGRTVVAACSYEARKFGVHSAMPMREAVKRCPELQVVPVDMPRYKQASKHIQLIFKQFTAKIEPLSLDEAFLDVTDCRQYGGDAAKIAAAIRHKIWLTQNLTASAGIAENKFLAKVASDWHKPNGQFEIKPEEVSDFVRNLPVDKIFGVGKATAAKMRTLNLHRCADLQTLSKVVLQQHFGKFGLRLYDLSRGQDEREVKPERERKSLSVEHTFATDLSLDECLAQVPELYQALRKRYQRLETKPRPHTMFVKLKFKNFKTTTAQQAVTRGALAYQQLCKQAWQRGKQPVRLMGLGLRFEGRQKEAQIGLL